MEKYQTPVKQNYHRSNNQQREGDWICLSCNNLNFSFRKKCNRCKIQTKSQNQSYQQQLYYYYYAPNLNTTINYDNTTNTIKQAIHYDNTTTTIKQPLQNISTATNNQSNTTPRSSKQQQNKLKLPSVSPLIKKYRNSKNKQKNNQENQANSILDFQMANTWKAFIDTDTQDKPTEEDNLSNDNQWIEKILKNIML